MATVTVFTAARMQDIEDASIASITFSGGILTFTRADATQITAGPMVPLPSPAPTVTGSRGGNAALASLLTALAGQGLIINSTTA